MKYALVIALVFLVASGLSATNWGFEGPIADTWLGSWGGFMDWQTMPPIPSYFSPIIPPFGPAPEGSLVATCKASSSVDFTTTYNATIFQAGAYDVSLKVRRVSLDAYGTNVNLCVGKRGEPLAPVAVTDQWVTQTLPITSTVAWQFAMAVKGNGDPWIAVDDIKIGSLYAAVLPGGFTVTVPVLPPPTMTGVSPSSHVNVGNVTLSITGADFTNGPTVVLSRFGQDDVLAQEVTFVSATLLTAIVDVTGLAPGSWDVAVIALDGQLATLPSALEIFGPTPTIAGISPNTGLSGEAVTTTLTGDNFRPNAIVKLALTGQPDVLATNVVVVNTTTITCTFNLLGLAPGAWDVVVVNVL